MASPSQNAKRFSKKNKIIIATLALVAVLLVSFWVTQQISFWPSHAVKPNVAPMQPITGYYLPFQDNTTKIFVVSASISSGFYPYSTRSDLSKPGGPPVVEKGEPCVIINVTVRNDYSTQYPPPNLPPYSSTTAFAWVFLTAKIFSGSIEINAADLTQVGLPPDSLSSASLNGGETATISVYLATASEREITSFQIVPEWIGGSPMA